MSRTIQITNSQDPKSPWIWQWDEAGRMIVPAGGDIVRADGTSVLGCENSIQTADQNQLDWKKYTVSFAGSTITVTDPRGTATQIVAEADCFQRIPLFRLPAGGWLDQAVIVTGSGFVCDTAASVTCGLGMEQHDDFFVACRHELLTGTGIITQNTGQGTSTLAGGLVFLTLDVMASVVANITAGTVNVCVRFSHLPL